jgi:hypothetical protein
MRNPPTDDPDLSGLSIAELYTIVLKSTPTSIGVADRARDIAIWRPIMTGESIEKIGSGINEPPGLRRKFIPGQDYWSRFQREFRRFICSNDPNDVKRRKEIFGQKSAYAVASAIAAQIGVALGSPLLAALVPICAMALIALLKIGKDALCGGVRWDVPLRPDPQPKTKPKKRKAIESGVKKRRRRLL